MVTDRIQRQIDRLLNEAEEAISQRDWTTVGDRAKDALRLDPDNSDAQAFLAAAKREPGGTPDSAPPTPPAETTPTEPPATTATTPEAERRRLTVMFCDLQGSTALSQQLDPEELRDLIRSYQEVCASAVAQFEGYIAKYLGDGLLVYFGYPQAHEDDPQRAVRAGLAIVEDMDALNSRLKVDKNLELAVRIGVHTGLVVAGEMGGGDTVEALAIVGETPNIAARLQEAAEPNSVVISDITANLIQGFFLYQALGCHDLKGISQPMELFAVLSESGAQTRFDIAAASQLTPLVGREQEVGLLLDRWEQAKESLGQVVLLSGEAGIGKSRLIEEVTERLAKEPHTHRQLRCSAYHQNSALHPVLEYLESWLGFAREDSGEERLGKLERALAKVDFPLAEAVPLLSGLLSVPLAERFPALVMSPEVQRERARELLVALLLDTHEDRPVFLVVEDLHWADPSTLAVLGLLLDQIPTAKVMPLLSFRPEFTPPWASRAYMTQVMLNRLTRRLAGEMVDRLTGGKSLPEEVFRQIASKSDGVPLFVEELTRMVVESGLIKEVDDHYELTGPLPPLAIPSTLQDSLTARLDRLAAVREVVQLAAVLGREFTYELIQAVSPFEEETLRSNLRQLVDSEFLYQRGLPPEAIYVFKHALIQDAAYQSLLRSRRQQYHQQTAQVLEEGSADIVEMQPELLAHHFAEAGLAEQAVNFWLRAGERALATYAHEEALAHFQRALAAKKGVPLSTVSTVELVEPLADEMDADGAALFFGLGRAQGAAGEVRAAWASFGHAFDYFIEVGDVAQAVAVAEYPLFYVSGLEEPTRFASQALTLVPPDSLDAGRLLSRFGLLLNLDTGDYEGANEIFNRALAIAERENDEALEMRTLAAASDAEFYRLRWSAALEKNLRVVELAQRANDPRSEAWPHWLAAFSLLCLGRSEEAMVHATAMQQLAEKLHNRGFLASASALNALAAHTRGEWQAARDFYDRELSQEPGSFGFLAYRSLIEFEVGDFSQGEAYLERCLETMRQAQPGPILEYGFSALVISVASRITGDAGRLDVAAEVGEAVVGSPFAMTFIATMARTGLGLLAVLRDDATAAGEHYAILGEHQGTMSPPGPTVVDRVLGLLAQTMGNLDQAMSHFEDSLAFCRKAGYRPELAWTCCDYADAMRERDGPDDRAKSIILLDESLAISSELGMRPLMERVLSRREILGA